MGGVVHNHEWGVNKRNMYDWLVYNHKNYLIFVLCGILLAFHPEIYTDMYYLKISNYVGCLVYAVIGIVFILIASSLLSKYDIVGEFFSKVGMLSLHVMCLHCMIIKIVWFILLVFAKRYYLWYDFNNPKGDLFLAVLVLAVTLISSIYGALWIDKHCRNLFNYKIKFKNEYST